LSRPKVAEIPAWAGIGKQEMSCEGVGGLPGWEVRGKEAQETRVRTVISAERTMRNHLLVADMGVLLTVWCGDAKEYVGPKL
jgi:hypothetical protein